MPIEVDCSLIEAEISNQAGIRVRVRVRNTGAEAVEVPSPWDMSGSLRFEVFDARWRSVRTINGRTRQALSSSGRIDERTLVDSLPPGGSWTRDLNLGEWHYPLPRGEYQFIAELDYPPSGVHAESEPFTFQVAAGRLKDARAVKDNPGMERLLLVLHEEGAAGPICRTRVCSSMRPLLARSEAALPLAAGEYAFPALAEFTSAATFEPFFEPWVVIVSGDRVRAVRIGLRDQREERVEPIPEGSRLIPVAHCDRDERLYFYFQRGTDEIECRELAERGFETVFRIERVDLASPFLISRFDGVLDVFFSRPTLRWRRIGARGESIDARILSRFPRPVAQLAWRHERGELAALVSDFPHGRSVAVEVYQQSEGPARSVTLSNLPRGVLREASIDLDSRGRLHTLLRIGDALYYYSAEDGPRLCARVAKEDCFPHVCAARNVFLGFDSPADGYRYRKVSFARHQPRLVDV